MTVTARHLRAAAIILTILFAAFWVWHDSQMGYGQLSLMLMGGFVLLVTGMLWKVPRLVALLLPLLAFYGLWQSIANGFPGDPGERALFISSFLALLLIAGLAFFVWRKR